MTKAIILVSGGIDSTVALYWAIKRGWEVVPLTFNYHARPEAEKASVRDLLRKAAVRGLIQIDMDFLKDVEDLKEDARLGPTLVGAPEAYIPARNMIFYSVAAYHAETLGADVIVGGHNGGDPEEFPDSSPSFFAGMDRAMKMGLWSSKNGRVRIEIPFKNKTKTQVLRLGLKLGVPLGLTWSCHYDGMTPCGKCSSCIERAEAFAALGVRDPHPPRRGKGIYRGVPSFGQDEAWDH